MRQGTFLFTISEYWWITTHQVRQVSDRPTYPKSQYVSIYFFFQYTYTNAVLTCGTPPETNIRKAENEDLDDDFGFQGDGHNSTVKMVRILSLATFSKIKSSSQIGNQINNFTHQKSEKWDPNAHLLRPVLLPLLILFTPDTEKNTSEADGSVQNSSNAAKQSCRWNKSSSTIVDALPVSVETKDLYTVHVF